MKAIKSLSLGMMIMFALFTLPSNAQKKVDEVCIKTSVKCNNCKQKIMDNIKYEKGVKAIDVDIDKKLVTIRYKTKKTSAEKLEKAIQKLDFETEIVRSEPKKCCDKKNDSKKCCDKKKDKKCCDKKHKKEQHDCH